jgi:hypothetical protein
LSDPEVLDLESAIAVAFPLRGAWTAFNTPGERIPSHGTDYFGQRYAFDFTQIDPHTQRVSPHGFWRHVLGVEKARACFAWAQAVAAPFHGRVIGAGDGWEDRQRLSLIPDMVRAFVFPKLPSAQDYRPLVGNYLLIEGRDGIALLAHLKRGSLLAGVGDMVRTGQTLGLIGNSGNSLMPHLHFHMMDGADPFTAKGLVCKFAACEVETDGIWQRRENYVPGRLETLRSVWE